MIWSRGCLICCSHHSGSQYKVSTDVKKKKKTSHSHFSLRVCFCRTLKTSLCLQCFCSPTFRPHTGHRQLCVRVNGGLVNSTREHGGDRCSQWQIHSDPEGQNWGLFETRIEVFHCIKQIQWISNQIYLTFSAQTLLKCKGGKYSNTLCNMSIHCGSLLQALLLHSAIVRKQAGHKWDMGVCLQID